MPRKKKTPQNESLIQSQCVYWFKIQYPGRMIFSIPNGAHKSMMARMKFKREGLLAGVPDLFIAEPNAKYHGLFIEMKDGYNKPSDAQLIIMKALIFKGYACVVCYTLDEFMKVIKDYFNCAEIIN